mmetsp:Transcript_15766/g.53821  ORF Transcript_15766/g.53821 Transcript_15766/m.53821 type:complete len:360 (-) Transcript_15766:1770-2849(-)
MGKAAKALAPPSVASMDGHTPSLPDSRDSCQSTQTVADEQLSTQLAPAGQLKCRRARRPRNRRSGLSYCQWCGDQEKKNAEWQFSRYRLCNDCHRLPSLPGTECRFCARCHKTVHISGFSTMKNRTCTECVEGVRRRVLAITKEKEERMAELTFYESVQLQIEGGEKSEAQVAAHEQPTHDEPEVLQKKVPEYVVDNASRLLLNHVLGPHVEKIFGPGAKHLADDGKMNDNDTGDTGKAVRDALEELASLPHPSSWKGKNTDSVAHDDKSLLADQGAPLKEAWSCLPPLQVPMPMQLPPLPLRSAPKNTAPKNTDPLMRGLTFRRRSPSADYTKDYTKDSSVPPLMPLSTFFGTLASLA